MTFWRRCVCVNTRFQRVSVTVAGRDGHPQEFDRPTGAEVADKEGLVAGSFGHKTSIARLEHKPGFTGQSRIAAAQSAGLRNTLSGSRAGGTSGRFVPEKPAAKQNRFPISIGWQTGDFPDPR